MADLRWTRLTPYTPGKEAVPADAGAAPFFSGVSYVR